jgi:hypothetical protein
LAATVIAHLAIRRISFNPIELVTMVKEELEKKVRSWSEKSDAFESTSPP